MTAAARSQNRDTAYRQVDLIRDATLIFFICYLLTGGLQRLLFGSSSLFGSGSILNQMVTLGVFGVGAICVLYQRIPFHRVIHGVAPFIIPAVLIIASLAWTDYFGIATRRAMRFWIELGGLLLLVSTYRDSRSFLRTLWTAFAILACLDVLSLAVPSMSFTSIGFAGVHGHKNTLGSFGYMSIPLFFIAWRINLIGRWSILSGLLGIATLAMLLISLSKTSTFLLPFCGVLAFLAYRLWERGFTTQLAMGGLFITFVAAIALPLTSAGLTLGEAIGAITGDPTITGRSEIWDYTIMRVGDRALTGVGYGSFWDVDLANREIMNQYGITFAFNQAHNGYIGVFAELGWLGVGAIVAMWLMGMSAILRRVGNKAEWGLVSYALYISIAYAMYNVTETSFFRVGFDSWIIYVLMVLSTTKFVAPITAMRHAPGRRRRSAARRSASPGARPQRPQAPRPVGRAP